jgi:SAM-dependent methyltransferase
MSTEFYNINAKDFYERTVSLDIKNLYEPFLERIEKGAHILDAGCGSGRDTKYFLDQGYKVSAFDASSEMVKLASALTGEPIKTKMFHEMTEENVYDGIWACASLLHVPLQDLQETMQVMNRSLKQGATFYASFKLGSIERQKEGRHFTDLNEDILKTIINKIDNIQLDQTWITEDVRNDKTEEWLNALMTKY